MKTFLLFVLFVSLAASSDAFVRDGPQEMPKIRRRVFPVYPEVYRKYGVDGKVEVKAFVTEEGKVAKTEVISSSSPELVMPAESAVLQWEFFPATKDGKAIRSEVIVPILFKRHAAPDSSAMPGMVLLLDQILALLRGTQSDSVRTLVDLGAYVVVGSRYEHLYSLILDKSKRDLLIEGPKVTSNFISITPSENGDMAVFFFKTRRGAGSAERFHTVVLSKTAVGQWRIRSWHVSY